MEKQTKLTYILFCSAIIYSILHNFFYAIFKFEEAVFFFLTLIAAFGFLISIIYNIITRLKSGKPSDIWKLVLCPTNTLIFAEPVLTLIQGARSEAYPLRYVSNERRRSRVKVALPKGKVHLWPILIERFLDIPQRVCLRQRSPKIGSNLNLQILRYLWDTTLSWIGIIGFLGMLPGVSFVFFGFYGFYAFFGFKPSHKHGVIP